MVLSGHYDAAYLDVSHAHSQAGAHIMLSENDQIPYFDGTILTIAQILKFGMSSA